MTVSVWQGLAAQEDSGAINVLASPSVTVTDRSDGSQPNLFSDYAGNNGIGNPFTANADGSIEFYVAPGRYRIEASSGGNTVTWDNVMIGAMDDAEKENFFDEIPGVTAVQDALREAIHPQTQAEIDAGVTPSDTKYEPDPLLDVRRNGAALDNSTDDSTAFANALSALGQRGHGELLVTGDALVEDGFTIPAGVTVRGIGRPTIRVGSGGNVIFSDRTAIKGLKLDFDGNATKAFGDGVTDVEVVRTEITGSTGHGLHFPSASPASSFIRIRDSYVHDNARHGIYINAASMVQVTGCRTTGNGTVDGHGVMIQECSEVEVSNLITHDNGNGSTDLKNGLATPACEHITVSNVLTYSNGEHGYSATLLEHFIINGLVTHSNGSSGLNLQSDNTPTPCSDGVVSGVDSYDNDAGLTLKEENEDIIFQGCQFHDNTSYQARLVDIGGSGLKSDRVRFMGCAFLGLDSFVNSNDSTRVYVPEHLNFFRNNIYTSQVVTATRDTEVTFDTRGTTIDFPEVFVVTDTGNTIARTSDGECIDGRRITIRADASGGVAVSHNQTGSGFAAFWLLGGSTVTLSAHESISFIGNGSLWLEEAGAYS